MFVKRKLLVGNLFFEEQRKKNYKGFNEGSLLLMMEFELAQYGKDLMALHGHKFRWLRHDDPWYLLK